ncbi:MAG TPA: C39 family peptidase [Candidatus Moranbacteria bacterium]|nr:C39 family peptidase [Candidatus Moranbacteria bacterium]
MIKFLNSRKLIYIIIATLAGLVFCFACYKNKTTPIKIEVKNQEIADNQNSATPKEEINISQASNEEKIKEPKKEKTPDKIFIKVPFTSQAPFSKWDEYHEEACEEASLIMVKYYLDKKILNKDIAEKEIQDMIKFEIKKYGDYKDTDAEETARLAEDYYGIKNLKVVYDFKPDDIKKYLAKGKPIVVPAAGRKLGNPNFTPPGPLYHNLVLVGYDGNIIIANDPGTRKGEGYKYDMNILYGAIHDFPGKPENIEKGRKAMIVLE